jgi:outer membrane protein
MAYHHIYRVLGASLLVGAALASPTAGAAQEAVRSVGLEEAIGLALEKDPAHVAAQAALTRAEADLLQVRGLWLPSVTIGSGYANSSNQRFDQATGQLVSESYTAQAAASYEIFSGGRRLVLNRSARAEVAAATAERTAQRFQTILGTKDRYYAAAAAAELVRAAEQRLSRARQQLVFAQTRLEVGSATRSDVLRAELEVGNAELALVDAESALRTGRLQLGRQLGLDEQVEPTPGSLPERAPALPPTDALVRRAERSAPAVLASQATLSARQAETLSAAAAYLPSVRASGGYDWFAFDFPPEQRSWSMRLTASLPLFNGFQREAAVTRARAPARVAKERARDAQIGVRVTTEDAARELSSAQRRVEIAQRAVELAREDLRVQEERYQIGNATILDLQTSQVALAEAEVASVRARQALGTSVGRLEAVLGTSLADLEL